MPPLPPVVVGESLCLNEVSLKLNTLLAFTGVLFAAMQGTLCMESADPCRISYLKLRYLLGLEVLEVVTVVTSEALSYVELSGALSARLTWLRWVPACLLILGLMEMMVDLFFTYRCATRSRILWQPFSNVGYTEDNNRFRTRELLELAPLVLTGGVSLVLVGWRQKWWLQAEIVSTEVAIAAAKKSKAFSLSAMVFCFVWGFALTGGILLILCYYSFYFKLYEEWPYVLNPKNYWENYTSQKHPWFAETDIEREKQFDALYEIQFGAKALENLTQAKKLRCLETTPLSMGNAVAGNDRSKIFHDSTRSNHLVFLFAEHFTILPIQICTAVGLVQLHSKLDMETLAALQELVDAVVVVAMVEIAVGMKTFLWGCGSLSELHENDFKIGAS